MTLLAVCVCVSELQPFWQNIQMELIYRIVRHLHMAIAEAGSSTEGLETGY